MHDLRIWALLIIHVIWSFIIYKLFFFLIIIEESNEQE